ncbi:MAG TPA: carbon-nitrogen hydrolase family protein [Burkholderiales bacterium]|nr:carbon-nitrogen hydrolase family protein [Burkholderiales bacterium]
MERKIKVAAAQTGPVLSDDWRDSVRGACAMIEKAARAGADVVCFSELFMTPFFPNTLTHDFDRYFATPSDPGLKPVFDSAADNHIALVFPFGEKNGAHYYNACLVADKDGRHLGIYRKTHIPAILPSDAPGGTGSYEKFYFSPGTEFPVFDLHGVKVGIQICYDRKYPEGSRLLALKGAEIIFMPICAATYGETKLRGNTWELPLQARAYENGVYVVGVNRAGDERGRNHIGRSMIIDPIGAEIMAIASSETAELLVATLDLEHVATAQVSLPWWRDRRPELYRELGVGSA